MVCLPASCSRRWDDLLMQCEARMDRRLLDAEMLAGPLVTKSSMFEFLAARRAEVSRMRSSPACSPPAGGPSIPATVIALQALHDYSDRETAGAVRFDVRWK